MKLLVLQVNKDTEKLFDPDALTRVVENTLSEQASAIKVDYGVTTQSWKNKPTFQVEKRPFERDIYTTDKIYGIVSAGSPPHKIRAKNAPFLSFRWGGPGSYKSKTTPRSISSRSGGSTGERVAFKEVNHPGHEAREFPQTINKKWDNQSAKQMNRAILVELSR